MRAWCRRRVAEMGLMIFFGLATLGGLGFIAVGAYVSAREAYAPWLAGLMVGAAIVILAVIAGLIVHRITQRRSPSGPPPAPPTKANQVQIDNAAHLGELIGGHVSQRGIRTTDVAIAALVAGVILNTGPAVRKRLKKRRRKQRPNIDTGLARPRRHYRRNRPK